MKNIVLHYHFINDQVGHIILTEQFYNNIKETYPDYKNVLTDETINPFGHRPTHIKVELWDNADLIPMDSESGTLASLLNISSVVLVGDFVGHLETF